MLSMKLINANEALAKLNKRCRTIDGLSVISREDALVAIECIPALDAELVRHGHWEAMNKRDGVASEYRCSHCKWIIDLEMYAQECEYDYCPYCGAKMDEPSPDE